VVLREVEVAAGRDALQFLHAEREGVFDVHAGARVVRQFLLLLPVLDEGVAGRPMVR
jgi:hypothetical protein